MTLRVGLIWRFVFLLHTALLLGASDPGVELRKAATNGKADKLQEAIAAGGDVDAVFKNGRTALMLAAQKGHSEIVDILLNAGADVMKKDRDGLTALDLVSRKKSPNLFARLEEEVNSVREEQRRAAEQERLEAERLAAEHNESRMKLLKAYRVGHTSEKDFDADGWDIEAPYSGRLGIVTFVSKGVSRTYIIGRYDRSTGETPSTSLFSKGSAGLVQSVGVKGGVEGMSADDKKLFGELASMLMQSQAERGFKFLKEESDKGEDVRWNGGGLPILPAAIVAFKEGILESVTFPAESDPK